MNRWIIHIIVVRSRNLIGSSLKNLIVAVDRTDFCSCLVNTFQVGRIFITIEQQMNSLVVGRIMEWHVTVSKVSTVDIVDDLLLLITTDIWTQLLSWT